MRNKENIKTVNPAGFYKVLRQRLQNEDTLSLLSELVLTFSDTQEYKNYAIAARTLLKILTYASTHAHQIDLAKTRLLHQQIQRAMELISGKEDMGKRFDDVRYTGLDKEKIHLPEEVRNLLTRYDILFEDYLNSNSIDNVVDTFALEQVFKELQKQALGLEPFIGEGTERYRNFVERLVERVLEENEAMALIYDNKVFILARPSYKEKTSKYFVYSLTIQQAVELKQKNIATTPEVLAQTLVRYKDLIKLLNGE